MKVTRVGVDLAKSVFQVHGVNAAGRRVWQRQLKRCNWLRVLSETVEPGHSRSRYWMTVMGHLQPASSLSPGGLLPDALQPFGESLSNCLA